MINKKLITLLSVVVGLVLISVLAVSLSNSKFLQGKIERQGKSGAPTTTPSTTDSNAPWWCKPQTPQGASGTNISNVPPDNTNTSGTSSSGSSKTPGGQGGIARFNPTNSSFGPQVGLKDLPQSSFKLPNNIDWKFDNIPSVKGGFGESGGVEDIDAPEITPVNPKKPTIKDNYECSCDAATFKIDGFDYNFMCPNSGEAIISEETDKNGIIHEITAFTPPPKACQKTPKKDETVNIWYTCACGQRYFSVPQTGKKYVCPNPGEYKNYGDGKPYSIASWSEPDYWCKNEWKCPDGYEWDWPKIDDDCSASKANDCSGKKLFEIKDNSKSLCKAFVAQKMSQKCEDIDKCKETIKLFKSGKSLEEIYSKGLPGPGNCQYLYGNQDSGIWN